MKKQWQGVFPAVTTQMTKQGTVDLDATGWHVEVLLKSGVNGLIFLGSLGENQTLTPDEKRLVIPFDGKIGCGTCSGFERRR